MSTYYGDQTVVRQLTKSVQSINQSENTWTEILPVYDNLVRPDLESDLRSIFSAWPPADGTNTTNIGVMWCYAMACTIHRIQFSTNTTGQSSALADHFEDMYNQILEKVKDAKKLIPGATRLTWTMGQIALTRRVFNMPGPECPIDLDEIIPRGLRR